MGARARPEGCWWQLRGGNAAADFNRENGQDAWGGHQRDCRFSPRGPAQQLLRCWRPNGGLHPKEPGADERRGPWEGTFPAFIVGVQQQVGSHLLLQGRNGFQSSAGIPGTERL